MGTLAVSFERPHRFGDDELALLQGLADQGAIAIANSRLTVELRRHADELADRVEAQRTLSVMAKELTSLRDPSDVLVQTLREAVRLLKGHGGQIGMIVDDPDGVLRWGDGHSLIHSASSRSRRRTTRGGRRRLGPRRPRAPAVDGRTTTSPMTPSRTTLPSDDVGAQARASVQSSPRRCIGEEGHRRDRRLFEKPGASTPMRRAAGPPRRPGHDRPRNARLNAEAEVVGRTARAPGRGATHLGEIARLDHLAARPLGGAPRTMDEAKRLLARGPRRHPPGPSRHARARPTTARSSAPARTCRRRTTSPSASARALPARRSPSAACAWTGDYLGDTRSRIRPRRRVDHAAPAIGRR